MLPVPETTGTSEADIYTYLPNDFLMKPGEWMIPSTNNFNTYYVFDTTLMTLATKVVAYTPFLLQQQTTFSELQFYSSTSGWPCAVGLYTAGKDRMPSTLENVMFSGNTTSANQHVTWSATLDPGLYWVAIKNGSASTVSLKAAFASNSDIFTTATTLASHPGAFSTTTASTSLTLTDNPSITTKNLFRIPAVALKVA